MTAISDNINALIRPYTIAVRIDRDDGTSELHRTAHPALLDQLADSTTAVTMRPDQATFTRQPGSKPAARLDAYALYQRIDRESARLTPPGQDTPRPLRDRLSSIAGASPDLDTADECAVRKKTRSWLVAARIITGHDTPAYAPDVPCPELDCERRGSLRIRLADRAVDSTATCVECGTVWDRDHILQLATYVAWASEHLHGARHWLTDGQGQLVECCECLGERQAMAERRTSRVQATTVDTPTDVPA